MNEDIVNQGNKDDGTPKRWRGIVIFLVVIVTWYGLSRITPLDTWLFALLARVKDLGFWGPVVFILLYIPFCVLMFPDFVPNAAAGALWGIGIGAVAVLIGRALGSAATFLLIRAIARRPGGHGGPVNPKISAVAEALEQEGFRIVLLLRLCPLFPVLLLNYTLGLTRVRFSAYVLGTFLGMIPRTLFVAYAGSGAHSLMQLSGGDNVPVTVNPTLYWGGLLLSLVIVLVLARRAKHYIDEATNRSSATGCQH